MIGLNLVPATLAILLLLGSAGVLVMVAQRSRRALVILAYFGTLFLVAIVIAALLLLRTGGLSSALQELSPPSAAPRPPLDRPWTKGGGSDPGKDELGTSGTHGNRYAQQSRMPGGFEDVGESGAIVTAQDISMAATHTARISSGTDLPLGVVRADAPASVEYRLKPLTEVVTGESMGAPRRDLLRAIRAGAYVDVTFGCNACDEIDNQQAPQRLVLDRAALSQGIFRSEGLKFRFTARHPSPALSVGGRSPHVSFVFRFNGRDLDTWIVPIVVLTSSSLSPTNTVRPAAAQREIDAQLRGDVPIRLQYYRPAANGPYSVRISAPTKFMPWLRSLGSVERHNASLLSVGLVASGSALMSPAANKLQGRLELVRRGEVGTTAACADQPQIPADQAALSAAIRGCISDAVHEFRTHALPIAVQQFLFDLARCDPVTSSDADWHRAKDRLPLLVVQGTPYLPFQFVPLDTIGDQPATCSQGLTLSTQAAATPADMDAYLGLLLPIEIEPDMILSMAKASSTPAVFKDSAYRTKRLLAGIYREDPLGEEPAAGSTNDIFRQMAKRFEHDADALLVHSATTFLNGLKQNRYSLDLIFVNAHGRRRGANEDTERVPPDNIIFSHWEQLEGNAGADVPKSAITDGVAIAAAIGQLPPGEDRLALAPTVLLLACETAPYREENSIPAAFITAGAGAVIVTETTVQDGLARDFGVAFLAGYNDGDSPAEAAFRARREVLLNHSTIFGLLWSVLSVPKQR